MRVLVDECLPRQLRQWLLAARPGWTVMTVQDAGWASMKNGVLLQAANGKFDVLVTADKNMHHQQNFAGLSISALV
jgi:predicted nuclease of predicted toxin-antitoxin system